MSVWLPTVLQTTRLHEKLIDATGGSCGIRDVGLLESALARAEAGYGGVELYETAISKAAAVCCGLVQNHAFIDGNKRVGVAVLLLILKRNGIALCYTQEELTALGLDIAQGTVTITDTIRWIIEHQV